MLMALIIFLIVLQETGMSLSNLFNVIAGVVIFVMMVVGAILIIISTRRKETYETETKRADANKGLAETFERKLEVLQKDKNRTDEELEGVTAEYRTLVGIDVAQLMKFWAIKEEIEARNADLEAEIRVLRRQKGLGDKNE